MSVTAAQLNTIIDEELDTDEANAFITTAEAIVASTSASGTYTSSVIDEITKYLAAHLAAAKNPPKVSMKKGESRESFAQILAKGLDGTRFGQTVKLLDYKGFIVRRQKAVSIKAMAYTA